MERAERSYLRRAGVVLVVLLSGCAGSSVDAPPPEVQPADVARISCRGTETDLGTPVVQATSKGLLVEVTNRTGQPVTIYGLPLTSDPGVHRHLVDVEPGVLKVACISTNLELERFEPQGQPLRIVQASERG